jgi:hypothetical protein
MTKFFVHSPCTAKCAAGSLVVLLAVCPVASTIPAPDVTATMMLALLYVFARTSVVTTLISYPAKFRVNAEPIWLPLVPIIFPSIVTLYAVGLKNTTDGRYEVLCEMFGISMVRPKAAVLASTAVSAGNVRE